MKPGPTAKLAAALIGGMTFSLAALAALGVFVIDQPAITAEDCTAEKRGPREPKPPQVELKRPPRKSVVVSAPGENKANFQIKGGKAISRSPAAVSAAMVAAPQDEDFQLLDTDVRLKARAIGRGGDVEVEVCAKRGGAFSAGTHTGTMSIYGPRVEEFRYEVVVPQRWHPVIPVVLLLGTAIIYLILVWRSTLPPGTVNGLAQNVAFGVVAVVGMAVTYFSVYMTNPTWGDAVPSDPAGLITGAATAAGIATAAAIQMRDAAKQKNTPPKDEAKKDKAAAHEGTPAPGGPR
jgi:hypothetical protein